MAATFLLPPRRLVCWIDRLNPQSEAVIGRKVCTLRLDPTGRDQASACLNVASSRAQARSDWAAS